MLKVQVQDAEDPIARAGDFVFAPVPCDALESTNNILGQCVRMFDDSLGSDISEEPIMVLAEMIRKGVDKMLHIARICTEKKDNELLDERIRYFYDVVRTFEVVKAQRANK
jgi:hypothetical protein